MTQTVSWGRSSLTEHDVATSSVGHLGPPGPYQSVTTCEQLSTARIEQVNRTQVTQPVTRPSEPAAMQLPFVHRVPSEQVQTAPRPARARLLDSAEHSVQTASTAPSVPVDKAEVASLPRLIAEFARVGLLIAASVLTLSQIARTESFDFDALLVLLSALGG